MGQLIREDNRGLDRSYVWTYENGNVLDEKRYDFTTGTLEGAPYNNENTYEDSEWGDILTSDRNESVLVYDEIGNLTEILYDGYGYDKKVLTWEGRQLKQVYYGGFTEEDWINTVEFEYNADGIRIAKEIYDNTEERRYEYILNGSQILGEIAYKDGEEAYTFVYIYDEKGTPIGIKYREPGYEEEEYESYYYEKNLQGDVVGIYNSSGEKIVTYNYNAWGQIGIEISSGINTTEELIVDRNPFRYRSYYYDPETGWYYLQSRYYYVWWCRFINADSLLNQESVIGNNMYVYCFNNPVNMIDDSGYWPKWMEDAANWVTVKIARPLMKFVINVSDDIKNFDINNQSEEKTLRSNYFSAYKGVPVIRIDGNRSGSFGFIFLTRETNSRSNPEDVLRHEYGHTKQLNRLGIIKYAIGIGIPSVFEIGGGDYYSRPWEITADIYGGVRSRNHKIADIKAGFKYLEFSKNWSPFIWIFMH